MEDEKLDEILETETITTNFFNSQNGKGLVVDIDRQGFLVKDLETKEIIHVRQTNFDYELNLNMLKEFEKEESVWVIGFNRETKECILI